MSGLHSADLYTRKLLIRLVYVRDGAWLTFQSKPIKCQRSFRDQFAAIEFSKNNPKQSITHFWGQRSSKCHLGSARELLLNIIRPENFVRSIPDQSVNVCSYYTAVGRCCTEPSLAVYQGLKLNFVYGALICSTPSCTEIILGCYELHAVILSIQISLVANLSSS